MPSTSQQYTYDNKYMTANPVNDKIYVEREKFIKRQKIPKFLSKLSTIHELKKPSVPTIKEDGIVQNDKTLSNNRVKKANTCAKTKNVANANTVKCLAYSSFM